MDASTSLLTLIGLNPAAQSWLLMSWTGADLSMIDDTPSSVVPQPEIMALVPAGYKREAIAIGLTLLLETSYKQLRLFR